MEHKEITDANTIEATGAVLREFESVLTNDLSELRRELHSFAGQKPDNSNRLKEWLLSFVGKHPTVQPANLSEIIELARKTITQQKPSERMVEKDVRDEITAAVDQYKEHFRDDRYTPPKGSDNLCPETRKILERAPADIKIFLEKLKEPEKKDEPKKRDTDFFVELRARLMESEKCVALDQLIRDQVPKLAASIRERLASVAGKKTAEAATGTEKFAPELVATFYVHYALFTEYFKSMKLLYQVLLKEYEELELLDDKDVLVIRKEAIKMIALRLVEGRWKGPNGAKNRADFRNSVLKSIREAVHRRQHGDEPERPIAALCLSGGGIRSATFSLGVIQALARHNLLSKFDYISTVSGGGYIGGWLSAWINRTGKSVDDVQKMLVERKDGEVEPPQVTHLRSYSNYMSPRLGLGSADTWTLIGVYLRNLLLNWTVVIPLAAAILLLPRIIAEVVQHGDQWVGPPISPAATVVTATAIALAIVSAFFSTIFRPSLSKHLEKIRWFSQLYIRDDIGMLRSVEPRIVKLCVLPMVGFAVGMTTYWAWGIRGERLNQLNGAVEFINEHGVANYIFVFVALFFVAAWLFNLLYRRRERGERSWDLLFSSLLFWACIGLARLQTAWLKTDVLMFGMVAFAGLIFIAGFFPARIFVWWKSTKKDRGPAIENVGHEFSIAFLSASLGGMLLFAGTKAVLAIQPVLGPAFAAGQLSADGGELFANIYTTCAVPAVLLVYLLAGTIFVGIGSKLLDDSDREWLSRIGAWMLIVAVGWFGVFALVLLAPMGLARLSAPDDWTNSLLASLGGLSGIITLLFGFFARGTAEGKPAAEKKKSIFAELLPKIAAPIFAAFLIVLLAIGTEKLVYFVGSKAPNLSIQTGHLEGHAVIALLIWFVGFAGVGAFMGLWININKFSLHAMYRDRIIRAYLGASRGFERLNTANSFTGLDENDNIDLEKLQGQRPFHVVNMTLNLASSSNLRWQNRKAESFTATPFHCGSSNMGEGSGNYRASKLYAADKYGRPITLGTAVAISGAAASPNMGYFTQSAPVSALMALFNIRLGWWLGNPGGRGRKTYRKNAPDFAPIPMANEALGRTGDTNSYVYLSDGGHFENLGLYEMVLRRCKFIVLCDAAADGTFSYSDLATAIHKIRVDMGVLIEFDDGFSPVQGRYCTIGHIRYSEIDGRSASDGILVYLKPTLNDKEPIDIANYKKKAPNFPHESTADQMYSETQFESYRLLGYHMMNTICGIDHKGPCLECKDLDSLEQNAAEYLQEVSGKKFEKGRPDLQ